MSSPPLRLISAAQLSELPPTETIGGSHFIARGLSVIFGASGTYKSFYTLGAALSIAQSHPVIYVAAEGAGGLSKRVTAWCEHRQLPPGLLYFICQEVNLLNSAAIAKFIQCAKSTHPAMVIFDTYARCIPGGDESGAKDCGLAVHHSAIIQRELSTAVTWIHHTNRAEKGERGSGAMRGAADTMIEMSLDGDGIVRVECSKIKDDEAWPLETYRFQKINDSGLLIPSAGARIEADHLTPQQFQVLELLALPVFTEAGAKAQQITSAVNISNSTIYRVLSDLKDRDYITQHKRGDPFLITDLGESLLSRKLARNRLKLVQ